MLRRSGAAVSLRALVSLTGVLLFLFVAAARTLSADDSDQKNQNWPQWRGPLCNGVAPRCSSRPSSGTKIKTSNGKSASPVRFLTPIIWGDQIFIHTAIPTGRKMEPPAEPPADASADNKKDAKDGTSTPPAQSGPPGGKGGKGMFNIEKAQRVLSIRTPFNRP